MGSTPYDNPWVAALSLHAQVRPHPSQAVLPVHLRAAREYESDGAFLCRGPCPDGYNRNVRCRDGEGMCCVQL